MRRERSREPAGDRAAVAALALALVLAGCGGGEYGLRRLAEDPAGGGDATLAPDGASFLTASRRDGNWDVWRFDLASGRWSRLTDHPADDFEARFLPDGETIVFTSNRTGRKDVWLKSLADGGERRLTDLPDDDEYPAVSADGSRLVFTGGPWEARNWYVLDLAAGEGAVPRAVHRRPLPAGGACTFDPAGTSLLCHKYEAGTGDLIRLWLEDGEAVPLTADDAWDYKPFPSPDGRWVAFSRSIDGASDIWLLETGTGRTRPLVTSPWEDRWPTWSADGRRLLFHRVIDRGRAVVRLDRASGRAETLVGSAESPLAADLDPAGERLAYCVQEEAGRALRVRHLGSGEVLTLDTGGEACHPRWSPDGERLAFVTRRDRRWEVAVAAADGSRLRLLTAGVAGLRGMDGPVDWSPDGGRVVFHTDTDPFAADLVAVDLASGMLERITDDPWFDESPAFTPQGDVVFMSTRGGGWTWGLFRRAADGGAIEPLVEPDYVEKNFPRAAADGTLLWSHYGEDGIERLVVRAPGGVATEVPGSEGARWASFHRGGREVLYTAVDHTVEYWLVENPLGTGSPWHAPAPAGAAGPELERRAAAGGPRVAAAGRSPVDKERR